MRTYWATGERLIREEQHGALRAGYGDQFIFRRVKTGQRAGYSRFRGRRRWDSLIFSSYGDGCKLTATRLYLQGVGHLKVKLHRAVEGAIKTGTVQRKNEAWYVVFSCVVETVPLPPTGQSVGIDMGLSAFHGYRQRDGESPLAEECQWPH